MKLIAAVLLTLIACGSKKELSPDAKIAAAKERITEIGRIAFTAWAKDNPTRECPKALSEFTRYLADEDMRDPWGQNYELFCNPTGVVSNGPDGKPDSGDDISGTFTIDRPATPPADAAVVAQPVDASEPQDRGTLIRDALNTIFSEQDLPAVALVDGSALVLMTLECDKKILAGFRDLLVAMKLDPSGAFETLECSGGYLIRFRGKDTREADDKRNRRIIRTEAVRALSRFLVANKFPFDVALSGEDRTVEVSKVCNAAILDKIASEDDPVGATMQRGGFTRARCADGTARDLRSK